MSSQENLPLLQAKTLLSGARRVALAFSKNYNGDILGSVGGIFLALKKLGKEVTVLTPKSFVLQNRLMFLAKYQEVFGRRPTQNELVICVDCCDIETVRYEKTDGGIKFFVGQKQKAAKDGSVRIERPTENPEAVVVVGAASLEDLGDVLETHSALFFSTPLILLANSPSVEHFAAAEICYPTSASLAEVSKKLIESLGEGLIDNEVATYLLCGVVAATKHFQSPKTTPITLLESASLILSGADHKTIVQHLYKTKPLEGLRLLGEVMKSLRREGTLAFAAITKSKLDELGASPSSLEFVAEELKEQFLNPVSLLLLWENWGLPPTVDGALFATRPDLMTLMAQRLHGTLRNNILYFSTAQSGLLELEEKFKKFLLSKLPQKE